MYPTDLDFRVTETGRRKTILDDLLGSIPVTTFLNEHYLKLPFASPAGCRHLSHLGDWESIERLLSVPAANVIVGREGRRWDGERPADSATVRRLMSEGFTVGLRHVDRHDSQLAELAAEFREALGAPVDIHLYCTPLGQPGFGWHYDAEEVFILQAQGEKEWCLRKNTVNPWPLVETIPANQRYEREIMPLLGCTLHAGDWLYIPGGYWHRTQAGNESVSLSVGLRTATAVNAHDFLRRRLLESIRWRQRLPCAGRAAAHSEAELIREYQTLFAALGQELADGFGSEEFARSFLSDLRNSSGQ